MAVNGGTRAQEAGASRWLVLEGIHHAYDAAPVVKGVDLVVGPGEIMCLLGPSGCGKTTLLRIAAGLERPSAGRVLIDGEEVSGPHRFVAPEKRRIGLMFQDYALFPHVRAIDNVGFGLTTAPRAERRRVAFAMLERLGLADLAHAYPHEPLRRGAAARGACACACAGRPARCCWTSRSPASTSACGSRSATTLCGFLHEAGVPIVLVTHDAGEALQMADQIALIAGRRAGPGGQPGPALPKPVEPVRRALLRCAPRLRRPGERARGGNAYRSRTHQLRRGLQGAGLRPARGRGAVERCGRRRRRAAVRPRSWTAGRWVPPAI